MSYNIPPLVNAYMNLSPTMKLFGTAINYGFGDVEETGILIAVEEIFEEKRVRHIDSFIRENPDALKITSGAHKVIYKEDEKNKLDGSADGSDGLGHGLPAAGQQ